MRILTYLPWKMQGPRPGADRKTTGSRMQFSRVALQHAIRRVLLPTGVAALFAATTVPCRAVLFFETADPEHNTEAPTGELSGSGWQFQGHWLSFPGTPIAPQTVQKVALRSVNVGQRCTDTAGDVKNEPTRSQLHPKLYMSYSPGLRGTG